MTAPKKTTTTKKKTPKKSKTLFKPGQSGNPAGKPKGTKNKSTIIKEAIENNMVEHIEGEAMNVLQKTIDMAKDGDTTCIKILMDRLWPLSKPGDDKNKIDKSRIVINVGMLPEGAHKPVDGTSTVIEGEVLDGDQKDS